MLKMKKKPFSRQTLKNAELNEDGKLNKKYRNDLVLGINAVTRALEKDLMAAVAIARGANPPHLTKHILPLCATRNVPVVTLKELNNALAKLMNISSLMALGIKRPAEQSTSIFHNLWKIICEKAASIPSPLDPFQVNSTEYSVVEIEDKDQDRDEHGLQKVPKESEHPYSSPMAASREIHCPNFLSLETERDKLTFPVYELPKNISVRILDRPRMEMGAEVKLQAAKLKRVIPSGRIKMKKKKV
ncbi:ribonuclease P protein subunit p38-like isoform X2 [Centruroides sculpturatus]|nr:ribonuclease P protein subunit p38-like isoform X2 [Centruroides sculpturatus]XP_023240552.1 ribonuclease P protein subunit p38-like isoform X2 [Centruroides sculpturatus]